MPGTEIGDNTNGSDFLNIWTSIDPKRIEIDMRNKYIKDFIRANETWLDNKNGKIDTEAMSIDIASCK
ncbi:hypothetical protein AYI70_g4355 [Smittium culicis]|uniref:Uncharacterized protein n=1 Tax=Smittium culicis TaxID=133412 RepID=A0A1R1XZV3_9FUNG|nr:hypothetical protein AYI70_g4355 [Smittium culicis]